MNKALATGIITAIGATLLARLLPESVKIFLAVLIWVLVAICCVGGLLFRRKRDANSAPRAD